MCLTCALTRALCALSCALSYHAKPHLTSTCALVRLQTPTYTRARTHAGETNTNQRAQAHKRTHATYGTDRGRRAKALRR